jgi:hypothetical protein
MTETSKDNNVVQITTVVLLVRKARMIDMCRVMDTDVKPPNPGVAVPTGATLKTKIVDVVQILNEWRMAVLLLILKPMPLLPLPLLNQLMLLLPLLSLPLWTEPLPRRELQLSLLHQLSLTQLTNLSASMNIKLKRKPNELPKIVM